MTQEKEALTDKEIYLLNDMISRLNERLNDYLSSDEESKEVTDVMQEEYSMMRKVLRIVSR